jgi:hypothetical protein
MNAKYSGWLNGDTEVACVNDIRIAYDIMANKCI